MWVPITPSLKGPSEDQTMAWILLTRANVASTLGVRPQQIDVWREHEGLPCFTLKFSRRRFYSELAVIKWAKEHGKPVYDIDRCFYQSSVDCPQCGQSLIHNARGHYKCPKGCKLPRRIGPPLGPPVYKYQS